MTQLVILLLLLGCGFLSNGPFINVIYGWSLKQIICKEVSERSKMDWSEKGQIGKLKRRKNKFL